MAHVDSCSSDNFVCTTLLSNRQLRSLGPSPPYAKLAAQGSVLKLVGSIKLSPEISGKHYPGTFFVSPDLENELVFGIPWFEQHRVIYEHCLGCIYLGAQERTRVYLTPEVRRAAVDPPVPELRHNFPPEYQKRFLETAGIHASLFHQGGPLRQTMAVKHEIHLSAPRRFVSHLDATRSKRDDGSTQRCGTC